MPSSVFFLVASLWTAVAKPLLGGTGDDYNSLFNDVLQNSAGSSVVGFQDIAPNQYFAEPLPVLSIPGSEPFEISSAPARLNENTFGASIQDSTELTSVPLLSGVQTVEISDGDLIPLEHNSQTTFGRDMSTITSPGENPCSGQD
ncbi:hypothetical protein MMC29_006158, partial [Sticta canariensis]|nr:hypothetical protein [Sticta canariensis]